MLDYTSVEYGIQLDYNPVLLAEGLIALMPEGRNQIYSAIRVAEREQEGIKVVLQDKRNDLYLATYLVVYVPLGKGATGAFRLVFEVPDGVPLFGDIAVFAADQLELRKELSVKGFKLLNARTI